MPSQQFAQSLPGELETVTVVAPGYEAGSDADGNPIRVAAAAVTIANVDIQPTSGSSELLPEAVRNEAEYQAFASADAEALLAGRRIERSDGTLLTISYVARHGTHTVLALRGQ